MTRRVAAESNRAWRRWWRGGAAVLLLAIALAPSGSRAAEDKGTVYIWRDASGVVRFTTPPPR